MGADNMPKGSSQSGGAGDEAGKGFPPANKVRLASSLGVVLFVVWLLLSGYFQTFLLTLGLLSCLAIVLIALRMDVVDREAHPLHLIGRIVGYWAWLLKEIWVAGIDVSKRVLSPRMPISPTLVQLKTGQATALGKVIYANSITLTPGTFTIRVFDDQILVHALSQEGADELAGGEMDRRVIAVEGGP